jgi:hypothetical protein
VPHPKKVSQRSLKKTLDLELGQENPSVAWYILCGQKVSKGQKGKKMLSPGQQG